MLILIIFIFIGIFLVINISTEIFKNKQEFPEIILAIENERIKSHSIAKDLEIIAIQKEQIHQRFCKLKIKYSDEIDDQNLSEFWLHASALNETLLKLSNPKL